MTRTLVEHYSEPFGTAAEDTSVAAVSTGAKWGGATFGTAGGTVTWSYFAGTNFSGHVTFDNSLASIMPGGYQNEIQRAFNAWEAVANIHFQQVSDGAGVDIRLGGSSIDGSSGILGVASWWQSGTVLTQADVEFDSAENWTLNTSGFSIFSVAVHEIGHAIGLAHETSAALAVMDPYYAALQNLQFADTSAIQAVYGASPDSAPVTITGSLGTAGNDSLIGSDSDDLMFGYAGNDTVYGGVGSDTLVGGAGKDLLTGAGGLDHMRFTALSDSGVAFSARDAVNTFAHGDKIDLSALDADTRVAGNQAFHFQSAFNGTAGQLIAVQVAANSFLVEADVNGDNHYDFSLNVYTSPGFGAFHSWDFIL
jgi:Ca2+-binding RTX toxin-like protein